MPFKSPEQRAYLFANNPKLAKRWARKHGTKVKKHGRQGKVRRRVN